jgi:tetratricopeptide (TPR) repeat protein
VEAEKAKLVAEAEQHAQASRLKKALAAYRKVVRLDPTDVRAQLKVAELSARTGDGSAAVAIFRAVGLQYSTQGKHLKATAVFKKIVELRPTDAEAHIALAECYRGQGLYNDAADEYRTALGLYSKSQDAPRVFDTVKSLLALDPDNVSGRLQLAEAFSKAGWIDDAAEQFRATCAILKRLGRTEDYVRCAERLLYHDPDDFDTCRELASIYMAQDYPQRALPKLHRAFRMRPRDPDVLDLLVECFDSLNQSHKAVTVLKALGRIYEQSGLVREFSEVMSRVLEHDPDDVEARRYFQAADAPQVAQELVFDELEGTPAPAASGDDDEEGFEDSEEPIARAGSSKPIHEARSGAPSGPAPGDERSAKAPPAAPATTAAANAAASAPPSAPPPAPRAAQAKPSQRAAEPERGRMPQQQELSLSGINIEDITESMDDVISSIPIVEPSLDENEELPFVVEIEPRVPQGGEVEWYDDSDRTLVDHPLTQEETTLVDAHAPRPVEAASASARLEIVGITRPPRSATPAKPGILENRAEEALLHATTVESLEPTSAQQAAAATEPQHSEDTTEGDNEQVFDFSGEDETLRLDVTTLDQSNLIYGAIKPPVANLSAELSELEFYESEGGRDVAMEVLAELERRHPGHPDLARWRKRLQP